MAWATSVGLLAYYLGPSAERVFKAVGFVGIGIAVVALLGYLAWRRFHKAGQSPSES